MDALVITYASYVALSVALTVWVAQALYKHGRVFLVDVFHGNEALADSVNYLLVVGFYLVNFGYASLALKLGYDVANARQGIEALSWKVGLVLVVLGGMHFLNLYVFSRIRAQALLRGAPPPVEPDRVIQSPEVNLGGEEGSGERMRRLTVLYDNDCALCRRARAWLERQPSYVPLEFVPVQSSAASARYPELTKEELLMDLCVVADDGRLWRGASAWVMCLWALRRYRGWAMKIARPGRIETARRFVGAVSRHRRRLSDVLMKWSMN